MSLGPTVRKQMDDEKEVLFKLKQKAQKKYQKANGNKRSNKGEETETNNGANILRRGCS